VSESAARSAQARTEEARRELERRESERRLAETAHAELALLAEGQLRAVDLQAAGAWRQSAEAEVQARTDQEQQAREARVTSVAAEGAERRALGNFSNQAKLIDAHRSAFRAELEATREATAEEAAAEQWTARHFPARRS